MKVNPQIFRGYDLRGLVGTDLSPELAQALGQAFGTYLKRRGITEVVVGHDSRATSPSYSEALIKGLSWAGADVINVGLQPVGVFYWSQYYLKRRGGVYVSASHNPAEYNGFKFADNYSQDLVSDGMAELQRMVEQDDFEAGSQPGAVQQQAVSQAYIGDVTRRVPIKQHFKVVVDTSNTTAGALAPQMLRQAGCEVVERNTKIGPNFPLGPADPTDADVTDRLRREVLEAKADLGITYDTDADRMGMVDAHGGVIWGDVLVALFAADVLSRHPGATIMFNTLCSRVVSETILVHGGRPFMWRTGHSFLEQKNEEVKAAFIGELSGHFFFAADFYNHDDGLYATLRLLSYLATTHQTLSEAVAALPHYISSPEIKLYCAEDKKVGLIKQLSPILRQDFPQDVVIDDERAGDGTRLDSASSMFVVRYSQNGPYITVKFEAKAQAEYDRLKRYIADILHRFPEIDWQSDISVNIEALR
jgi:phosphomannomutase / phosphoglucomutase